MSMSQYWNSGRSRYLNFEKVVIKLQHVHLGVLQNEKSHVYGQAVRYGSFVHLYLVRIVDDDVELSEPSIVIMSDAAFSVQYFTSRCRSTFMMAFPYPEFPSNFMVSAMMALCGCSSQSRRAVDTTSPNRRKHGTGSSSMTW